MYKYTYQQEALLASRTMLYSFAITPNGTMMRTTGRVLEYGNRHETSRDLTLMTITRQ